MVDYPRGGEGGPCELAEAGQAGGCVAQFAGYNGRLEYSRILGGRYRIKMEMVDKVERPGSVYQHEMKFTVTIGAPRHPVTRGLKDIDILDETDGDFDVGSDVKPLRTTDHPTSSMTIAWRHQ